MKKTQEQIQLEISGKVEELRVALVKQEGISRMLLSTYRRSCTKVDQQIEKKFGLETHTRNNGNGNEFENLVNEISNLFQEFRVGEKQEIRQ